MMAQNIYILYTHLLCNIVKALKNILKFCCAYVSLYKMAKHLKLNKKAKKTLKKAKMEEKANFLCCEYVVALFVRNFFPFITAIFIAHSRCVLFTRSVIFVDGVFSAHFFFRFLFSFDVHIYAWQRVRACHHRNRIFSVSSQFFLVCSRYCAKQSMYN